MIDLMLSSSMTILRQQQKPYYTQQELDWGTAVMACLDWKEHYNSLHPDERVVKSRHNA